MKCGFCGYEFSPQEGIAACSVCPLAKNCRLVRCPRCGFEMPPEATLVRLARELHRRLKQRSHTKKESAT